jgi:hypothetical protein
MSSNLANSIYVSSTSGSLLSKGTTSLSSISGGSGVSWASTGYSNVSSKHTYNIMGDDIEVDGYYDTHTAVVLASINLLGWKYYEELLKQGVSFSEQIEREIKKRYTLYLRDSKIESILD